MARPLENLRAQLEHLSARDRALLGVMGLAIALFVVFLVATSFSHSVDQRKARIRTESKQLREVVQLTRGYRQAETQREAMELKLKANAVHNLFSYIDNLGKKDGLEIGDMTDKGTAPVSNDKSSKLMARSVDVTLTRVKLGDLTQFLNDVERSPGMVRVTRLQVRPRQHDAVLDAWFTVSTYYVGS